jgi:uncharacterized cupredoxin-like copper-binding protein
MTVVGRSGEWGVGNGELGVGKIRKMRKMRKMREWGIKLMALLVCFTWLNIAPAMAIDTNGNTVNMLKQTATEIKVDLGNSAGELKFEPNHLEFQTGKRYNLRLANPSNQKHYFTAKDFADGIWTQKVEAGKVEIKGAIHELELKPGAEAEWVFVALKPGKYTLRCPIVGHTEAGMTGEIIVKN